MEDVRFWVGIGVQVFLALAGFAIAIASAFIAMGSADVARMADARQ